MHYTKESKATCPLYKFFALPFDMSADYLQCWSHSC